MRRAMAEAVVGDDVYGEDPSVQELEQYTANLLAKPRALFVPSGTMANQIALLLLTRPGHDVVVSEGAHIANYEAGAGAALAGVQFTSVGHGGAFTRGELEQAMNPPTPHMPQTSLVCIENTHNLAGGKVFPQVELNAIIALAKTRGLRLHLDGARIWHASEATRLTVAQLADGFDTVSVCFSKGLGAPVGSALVASDELIDQAWRFRKMLGGGMRQAGVVAAGALYALRHQRADLGRDHEKARGVAAILSEAGLDVVPPETNMVFLKLGGQAESSARLAAEHGVLVHAMGPDLVRLVLHRDIAEDVATTAAHKLANCLPTAHINNTTAQSKAAGKND
jgi:threonine aldolase